MPVISIDISALMNKYVNAKSVFSAIWVLESVTMFIQGEDSILDQVYMYILSKILYSTMNNHATPIPATSCRKRGLG